jgi:hypothetical protein
MIEDRQTTTCCYRCKRFILCLCDTDKTIEPAADMMVLRDLATFYRNHAERNRRSILPQGAGGRSVV